MNARLYNECPSWRGFGWCEGPRGDRYRVLGNDGARARVEYLDRGAPRPRAWVALTDPALRPLARWIATGPAWVNPSYEKETERGQLALFAEVVR